MFKFYVCWPNGHGYTKDLATYGDVQTELVELGHPDYGDPVAINVTWLDEDVARGPEAPEPFGRDQVGDSALHGTKVRD